MVNTILLFVGAHSPGKRCHGARLPAGHAADRGCPCAAQVTRWRDPPPGPTPSRQARRQPRKGCGNRQWNRRSDHRRTRVPSLPDGSLPVAISSGS